MTEGFKIPVIRLYDTLIVSIQGNLSDALVRALKADITAEIEQRAAHGLVIDVSGVDVLDSYLSKAIYDIAQIAALMGTQTVLSGLDPMLAMTLVEMGLDLAGVATALNLESALEYIAKAASGGQA